MKRSFIILVFLFILATANAKDGAYRDPFESLIPTEVQETTTKDSAVEDKEYSLPPLKIQGVLWGSDLPQAIIEGDVYKVGDKLKKIDAQVFRIERNTVFISYRNKIYELKAKQTKLEEEKE